MLEDLIEDRGREDVIQLSEEVGADGAAPGSQDADRATIRVPKPCRSMSLAHQITCECRSAAASGASPEHGLWVRWLTEDGQHIRLPRSAFVPEE